MYEGEWRKNRQDGQGTMHWFRLGEVYTGQWENGCQQGVGTHLWKFESCDSSQVSLGMSVC